MASRRYRDGEGRGIEERLVGRRRRKNSSTAGLKAAERGLADEDVPAVKGQSRRWMPSARMPTRSARTSTERAREVRDIDTALLAKYAQLLKQRKGIAVFEDDGRHLHGRRTPAPDATHRPPHAHLTARESACGFSVTVAACRERDHLIQQRVGVPQPVT